MEDVSKDSIALCCIHPRAIMCYTDSPLVRFQHKIKNTLNSTYASP